MKDTDENKYKKQQLDKVIKDLETNVNMLPLAKNPRDIVPPEGNPTAEIMFIGEAAGYHESVQRRPFVGLAGKLLIKSLKEIDLERKDVWITNILKVRPPQNRDPLPKEIEAYRPYLDKEIEIINPKIIVTLGRFSMGKFIPNIYISKAHGQARWIDWQKKRILIFPMYHPAAALRNGNVMQMFQEDFNKLKKIKDTLNNQSNNLQEYPEQEEQEQENKSEEQQLQLI